MEEKNIMGEPFKLTESSCHKKRLFRWISIAVLILVVSHYFSNNLYSIMLVQGNSMSPTYHNMQLVILDRRDRDFSNGDVIAFQCESLSAVLVKRVAACPGDMVVIENDTLYINEEVSTIYPEKWSFEYAGLLEHEIRLGEGQYIVIGDNVSDSKDSRFEAVGIIEKNTIIGKIMI